jgi:hypothetical protein
MNAKKNQLANVRIVLVKILGAAMNASAKETSST